MTSVWLSDSLIWCSVRQSRMMYFIALPEQKHHEAEVNVVVLLLSVIEMNEYLVFCALMCLKCLPAGC